MQLSRDEFLKVSVLREQRDRVGGIATMNPYGNFALATAPHTLSAPGDSVMAREIRHIADSVDEMPETRNDIVASLRARIESGTYQVSADSIAEMMLRRMMADRAL